MNLTEFHKQLADAPLCFRRKLRDYLRYPTERNACFIAGYAAALEDTHRFKTADAARYWSAVIGRAEANATVCRELIAEVDNPPVEDVKNGKKPGIEDLEHETDYCAARNDRIERSALRDEALLRQALEALERGAWDTLRGRNAAAAIRERLGEEEQQ